MSEQTAFETLLTGFVGAERRTSDSGRAEAKGDKADFRSLLDGYDEVFRRWRARQATAAEDFNVVELLGITRDENRHSDVLAWLLDADPYRATHSQANQGFRAFLRELELPAHYASGDYKVGREIQGAESRVDIEIAARGRFVIHIEVKVGSGEGASQLEREWRDLQRTADRYEITNEEHIHALYLTPLGEEPSHKRFRPISWQQMTHVFEEFAKESVAESVRWFASHYALALHRYVIWRREEEIHNA
jgi:hypothetical protein